MKNPKRLCLLLVLTLCATLFLGASALGEEDAFDFGGYNFVLASPWAQEYVGSEDGMAEKQELFLQRIDEIETQYNCTIEVVKIAENINELVTTSINAGEKFADFIDVQAVNFYALKANNMLYNLSTLDAYTTGGGAELWASGLTEIDTYEDGTYGIWRDNTNKMVMWVNDSMRARLNLEPIEDLIERGEWTWDKYLEYMLAATEDTDKDGNNDTYGVIALGDSLALATLCSNNAAPVIYEGGKYVYNGTAPEVIEAVNFYADLHRVHNVVAPAAEGDWDAAIFAFMRGNTLFFPYNDWCADEAHLQQMEDDYVLRPLPMGPNADDYMTWCTDYRTLAMPANVEDAETAMAIMNLLFAPLEGYGPDDEFINMRLFEMRDDLSVEWKIKLRDHMDMMYLFPTGGPYYEFIWNMDNVAAGENTAAAAMEGMKDTMQTALDDTYRQ